jgi:transcription initiation factor IIE alpha subunit
MSKAVPLEDHLLQTMSLQPGKFTIDDLVKSMGMPASSVRKAIGWLYGRGFTKIDSVNDGKEVWRVATMDERRLT